MNISREQWAEFCNVKENGQYNMVTQWESAIKETSLNKKEWFYIIDEYLALEYRFSKPPIGPSSYWLLTNLELVQELIGAEVFFSEDHDNEQMYEAIGTAIHYIKGDFE